MPKREARKESPLTNLAGLVPLREPTLLRVWSFFEQILSPFFGVEWPIVSRTLFLADGQRV